MMSSIRYFFTLLFFFPVLTLASIENGLNETQVNTLIDKTTGLKTWQLTQSDLELQLVQRLPDQTRGFFQGRGFNKQQANEIATQCVFQTIVKNTGLKKTGKPISISLKNWRIIPQPLSINKSKITQGIKLKEDWANEWLAIKDKNKQVKPSARIAFKWATFPSEQTFEPGGDYNWGMISFGLSPGAWFDLHIFWQSNQASEQVQFHDQWIKNIQCPEDK